MKYWIFFINEDIITNKTRVEYMIVNKYAEKLYRIKNET